VNHCFQVYDGPYLTSPLLLSHNTFTRPTSIRSSSNNLYIEFPVNAGCRNFSVDVDYKSVSLIGSEIKNFTVYPLSSNNNEFSCSDESDGAVRSRLTISLKILLRFSILLLYGFLF
jgi:hypothetical protein